MNKSVENLPVANTKLLCRHPFDQKKRAFVVPSEIQPLYKVKVILHSYLKICQCVYDLICYVSRFIGKMAA